MENQQPGTVTDIISGQPVRATPEETEAVQPFLEELLATYDYPREHIRTRPQWRVRKSPSDRSRGYPVDIVIFNDDKHDQGNEYIVVECKKKNRKDGRKQLVDYLSFCSAKMGVWYNGQERLFLLKTETTTGIEFGEIPNIPRYGQRVEDIGQFQRKDLQPSKNLKTLFTATRNHWAANAVGMTRDEVLAQQLINLVLCKIYDEQYTPPQEIVRFRIGTGENSDDAKERIDNIFNQVKAEYPEIIGEREEISLDKDSLAYFVGEIQQYCLVDSPRDAIADAFESFISNTLKGPQGQFFTPRNVVNLIVGMVDPNRREQVVDPACGSGGFLIEILRHFWHEIDREGRELNWSEEVITREKDRAAARNIKGVDKDEFLAKVAKAYMAITGDGRGGIFCENSLEDPSNWQRQVRNGIQKGLFDVVVTNPPFGKKLTINEASVLRQFNLGFKWSFNKETEEYERTPALRDSQPPQILFVERCMELLKPGGRMGIIVPESMFSNPSHRYIVQYLESVSRIRAVVSMPEELFQPYTHAKTAVVILEKHPTKNLEPHDHEIFMGRALWCGHDSRGKTIDNDDIPHILKRYQQYKENANLEYDHLGFVVHHSDILNHIYLPKYYNPEIPQQLDNLRESHELVRFGDLVRRKVIEIRTGDEVGKTAYRTGTIPFIRTSDIANWEVKADPKHGLSEDIYELLKDRQDVQENDILMVRDGTYLVGTCAMVTRLDTRIVYQSHIYKIRSNDHKEINPYLLLALLSAPVVQNQIYAKRFTQDIIDTLGRRVNELVIPIPKNNDEKSRIIDRVTSIMETKVATRQQMAEILWNAAPTEEMDPEAEYSFFLRNIN